MITKENFKSLLLHLYFIEDGEILSKYFADTDSYLKVDFKKKEIIYPIDKGFKVNGEFTLNFNSDENFVVFECVHRLFEKGYKPEHIELEPKWKVGHGASGGRADILVKDNSGKALLIIECKTEGNEFKKEWNNTLQRGGQLMSYVQNAGSTKYICLYASDFTDNKIISSYYVVSVHDNEKLLEELKDKKPLSFAAAKALEVEDIYKAWRETYSLDFATKGIFEEDIQAYHIGKNKYSVQDLSEVGSKDIQTKYHEFATIMRQHNVSGRENAFDKLVNLFLCKIVDEAKNPKDLKFNWKGIAYDSYFDLQDRLQLLYQAGMKEFLGEDVTYIDNASIDKAFRFFKKDPDATRETIKKYFRQLKFFTNNDFAFIDVHNEKLFYQNSAVLLKIVQMLQDTRLQSENQNQFLGDMFEGFLDQGVKQSEGQFFTPMPIVKFILNSLPLENIIKESELPPKAVDYACGAGHFLNELALQIKPFVKQHKETDIKEYYKEILGIEKEYRLSKVAKVSAFMYGQDDIKITYADALGKKAKLQENEYSILVANPPYSVKGFLQTLTEQERKSFELINTIDEKSFANNNSIETFFIERAKQLLKSNGVAGIILPTSILSNDSNIYCTAREILIKYFDIISIVEFGSQTFGKTGTNTATLFLRRKDENPSPAEHWQNRVNSWFTENDADAVYNDGNYINNYCNHISVDVVQYKTLLAGKPSGDLLKYEMFDDYKKAFDSSTEIKNLTKPKSAFSKKSKAEQEAELQKRFAEYLQSIEKDKLYFYVLASENKQKILVVKCPSDNKEQKQFLGYEWSSAKGNEGIKYINQVAVKTEVEDDAETKEMLSKLSGMHNINTPLYNPNDRNDTNKINNYIEQNFVGNELPISESLTNYIAYYNLSDMLDFSRKDFNKQISLTPKKTIAIQSKWDVVKMGEVVNVNIGGTPARDNGRYFGGKNLWVSISEMKGQIISDTKEKITGEGVKNSNVKLIPQGTTLLSFKLSIGKTAIAGKDLYTNEAIAGLIPKDKSKLLDQYLFYLFNANYIDLENTGLKAFGKSLNSEFLKTDVKIPVPPKEIQVKIIAECEIIRREVGKAENEIEKGKEKMKTVMQKQDNREYDVKKLSSMCSMQAGKFVTASEINDKFEKDLFPCYGGNGLRGYTKTFTHEGNFPLIGRQGALCGNVKIVSGKFHATEHAVVVTPNPDINATWLYHQLEFLNLNQYATGAAQPGLSVQKILTVSTPVPPLKDQLKLVEEIEELEQAIKKEQAKIDTSVEKIKAVMKKHL